MNPHDRFYRACQGLPPVRLAPTFRKLRGAAWIAAVLLAWAWMLGNAQQADQRAQIVAQAGK